MAENKKRRIETNVARTINIGNFESVKIGCTISTVIQDKADIKEELAKLWAACEGEIEAQSLAYEPDDPTSTSDRTQDKEPDVIQGPAEEDITEEQIMAMSKPELIKLIKTEELEVDIKVGVKALRVLVVDDMFEDDPEPEQTPEPELEDESPEEDEIMAMGKPELLELIEKEKLEDIDTSKSAKVLQILIIDALFEEDPEYDNGTESGADDNADTSEDEAPGGEWKDTDWE